MRTNSDQLVRSSMKNLRSVFFYTIALALVVSTLLLDRVSLANRETQSAAALTSREDAYRLNNIGVALLEQFKHKEAAEAFRNALKIDPKLTLAQINLGIALFNVPDLPAASRQAQT